MNQGKLEMVKQEMERVNIDILGISELKWAGMGKFGILQARILEWVAFTFSRDLPNPEIEPRSPTLQADSLPAEPQGKPKNTGVVSLSIPSPADLPNPGIEAGSPALQADSLPTELSGKPQI